MRISNRNLIMNQLRNMNTTLANFTNSNNRMTSGRKFDHAYENVADATRAMRLRKSIRDKEYYITNIRDARGRLNSAEDAIQTTVNILRSVTDRVEEALNGTVPEEDRKKIATEISNLQEEVLSLMNTTYTDHPVFSGSGYKTKNEPPFQTQGNKLFYHGVDVSQLQYDKETGTYRKPIYDYVDKQATNANGNLLFEPDGTTPIYVPEKDPQTNSYLHTTTSAVDGSGNLIHFPAISGDGQSVYYTQDEYDAAIAADPTLLVYQFDGKYEQEQKITGYEDMEYTSQNYLDIGIGHTFKQNADGTFSINPETVHQFTYSGVEVFGAGRTGGMSNNVYAFLGEIADSMNNNNMDLLGEQLNHIKDVREHLLTSITEIGVRSNFLDTMEDIHKNDLLNFQTRQKDVEAVDLPQEAMNNKNHEMAWMVTLQMGSKVLPSSLFDFLR